MRVYMSRWNDMRSDKERRDKNLKRHHLDVRLFRYQQYSVPHLRVSPLYYFRINN